MVVPERDVGPHNPVALAHVQVALGRHRRGVPPQGEDVTSTSSVSLPRFAAYCYISGAQLTRSLVTRVQGSWLSNRTLACSASV